MSGIIGHRGLLMKPVGPFDPYYADVRSLLLMLGPNGSTTFNDEKGIVWTPSGNAQISTSLSLYGGSAYLGDGNNDYITASSASLAVGTQDFCIEAWVAKLADTVSGLLSDSVVFDYRAAEPSLQLELDINGSNYGVVSQRGALSLYVNGADRISATDVTRWDPMGATFRHFAYERIGGVGKLYVQGVASSVTYADTNNYTSTTLFIGGRFAAVSGDRRSLNGAIDSTRLTVRPGGRYGGNFTPGQFLNVGP